MSRAWTSAAFLPRVPASPGLALDVFDVQSYGSAGAQVGQPNLNFAAQPLNVRLVGEAFELFRQHSFAPSELSHSPLAPTACAVGYSSGAASRLLESSRSGRSQIDSSALLADRVSHKISNSVKSAIQPR